MGWWFLLAAGVVEIGMAIALKRSDGWSQGWPSVIGILAALCSIFLLAHALRTLPMGMAYAIWTGIGAIGITTIGIIWFDESASPARLFFIALIVAGMAGLKLLDNA
jgi:quaternary ammonium compound-resistance protein SugE